MTKQLMKNLLYCLLFVTLYSFFFYSEFLLTNSSIVFRDVFSLYIPFETVIRNLRELKFFPLWNPHHVLGKPIIGEPLSGILYPPSWLFWLFPQPLSFNLSLVFHHIIATTGMIGYLRLRKTALLPALIGGLLYGFGGVLVSMDNMLNALQSAAWSSWSIFALQYFLINKNFRGFCFLSLTLSLTVLGGLPEILILENIACTLLILEASLFLNTNFIKNFIKLICANLFALCLSGALLFPLLDYLLNSSRATGVDISQILRFSFNPKNIVDFIFKPDLFNENGFFNATLSNPEAGWAISKYVGPFVLLGILALKNKGLRYNCFILACLTFCLIASFGSFMPGYESIVSSIPLFKSFRYPEKFLFLTHGLLTIGVAVALDKLFKNVQKQRLIFTLLLVLVCWDLFRVNSKIHSSMSWRDIYQPPTILSSIQPEIEPYRIYSNRYQERELKSYIDIVIQKKELLDQLTANFYGIDNINTPISINLQDHEKLNELISKLPKDQAINLLRSLNVAYITSQKELINYRDLVLIKQPETVNQSYLYKITSPISRVYVPETIKFVGNKEEAFEYLKQTVNLPKESIIVTGEKNYMQTTNQIGDAIIKHYAPEEVEISVNMSTSGFVILSDTFLNGWKATIDDIPTEILRANYFSRAIFVDKGTHQIIFKYEPITTTIGAWVSFISILVFCLLLFL